MRAPAQPTDLLLVPAQVLDETRLGSHVSHQYLLVFGATGDERARPGAGADSVLVPAHTADHLLLLNVPDLHMTVICAHGQVRAFLRPSDGCDSIALAEVDELAHARRVCVPDVDVLGQRHCQRVRTRPVNQVQIEVVTEVGSIENFVRSRGNLSYFVDQDVVRGQWLRS